MFKRRTTLQMAGIVTSVVVIVYAVHVAMSGVGGFIEVVAAVFALSMVVRWVRDWHAGEWHFGDPHVSDRHARGSR